MKAAFGLLLGTLATTAAQAQSVTQTKALIALYEQPPGTVLGMEKRIYTAFFNTLRTRSVAVEITLEYPAAPATSRLSVGCQMTRPDGRVVDGIWKIGLTINAGSTRAVGANVMFGPGREGWQTGIHKVTCAATSPLGEASFQMSPGPSLLGDLEFRLADLRFFPTGAQLTPVAERKYENRFESAETTRIGIELTFVHPGRRSGEVPITCSVLPSISRILGVMQAEYTVDSTAARGSVAVGLGWDQPGQWAKGDYLAICQIHGRPIAVERFSVW